MRTKEEIDTLIANKKQQINEWRALDALELANWKQCIYTSDIYILECQIDVLNWVLSEVTNE
jgi:hypothetical protein